MKKVLITCPPMIKQVLLGRYDSEFEKYNLKYFCPEFEQSMEENEIIKIIALYDYWIIGDDKVTRNILETGKKGKLIRCVRWGVGCDNIDFELFKELNIPITNTPNVFGNEVADLCLGYMIGLSRDSFYTDRMVRNGEWNLGKVCGISMTGKKVCVIGFGDIGKNICKRLLGFDMDIWVSDPFYKNIENNIGNNVGNNVGNNIGNNIGNNVCDLNGKIVEGFNNVKIRELDLCLEDSDFIVVSCSLNKHTYHLLNREKIMLGKKDVRIINISRGSIINEKDLIELLEEEYISRVALDVFETEPIDINNKLLTYDRCIVGCHNGSNTVEAVDKVSKMCLRILSDK